VGACCSTPGGQSHWSSLCDHRGSPYGVAGDSVGEGPHLRRAAASLVRSVLVDPGVTVIHQSHESFLEGLALYERRLDKGYSLVDCISMNVMRRQRIRRALTNDRHFGQEGFTVLVS